MKRFMIASALALTTATTAFAATDNEIARIQQYLPDVDVSTWSNTQVAEAMNIITSTDSHSDIENKLEGIVPATATVTGGATLTENEMVTLSRYVDNVDFTTLPQPIVDSALSIANSEDDESEAQRKIESLLVDYQQPADTMGNGATEAQMVIINRHAPSLDVSTLSDTQVDVVLNYINSTDDASISENEILSLVQ
ncbi:hypothetical protein OCH239_21290 [Roseivivax halodurans JCM 10272]|uniref:EF-hand domain-containing protein n=1 Tax=Roseivivax halodurans JCM 10272 TaxID=1449350 RepID=X7EFS2_9RHOB|nr:hypothetical protein [Roseivivax halodurans]ETX14899.1 hypothetical protein OCH239_21290 [Roseivivax halodurans JCM 10272]